MNVLVTAGNTLVPIDRVRVLTNVFTGRTGAALALHARGRGHSVTLLTSHPDAARELAGPLGLPTNRWSMRTYRTFEDLEALMNQEVATPGLDAIFHSAAVSDYLAGGIYAAAPGTRFHADSGRWENASATPPTLLDRQAGKVKSDEPELWLRLVRAPKLVDLIRPAWGFRGVLVKFKLEAGVSDERLQEIAEQSRQRSQADLMVANTLEEAAVCAWLGPIAGRYERVPRRRLPERLLEAVEKLHRERTHG